MRNWQQARDARDARVAAGSAFAKHKVVETRDVKQPDHGLVGLNFIIVDETGKTLQEGSARLLMHRKQHEKARWGLVESTDSANC